MTLTCETCLYLFDKLASLPAERGRFMTIAEKHLRKDHHVLEDEIGATVEYLKETYPSVGEKTNE